MTRAELHGALDRIAGEFLDSLRDGHSLSYWRQELPPTRSPCSPEEAVSFAADRLSQLSLLSEATG